MNDQPSNFDPSVFLGATVTEANTRRPPLPAGKSFTGVLGEPKYRQSEGKKETNLGVVYHWIDIPIQLEIPADLLENQGTDQITLQYSFRLDISENGQGFDMSPGKNNGMRQLREAVGMNTPGQPFVLSMVQGQRVLVRIKHETYEGDVFDRVAGIAKIS